MSVNLYTKIQVTNYTEALTRESQTQRKACSRSNISLVIKSKTALFLFSCSQSVGSVGGGGGGCESAWATKKKKEKRIGLSAFFSHLPLLIDSLEQATT